MLVVAYLLNAALVQKVSEHGGNASSCAGITLIALFILFTIADIYWIVQQFLEFGHCFWNKVIMSATCLMAILMYIFAVKKVR